MKLKPFLGLVRVRLMNAFAPELLAKDEVCPTLVWNK